MPATLDPVRVSKLITELHRRFGAVPCCNVSRRCPSVAGPCMYMCNCERVEGRHFAPCENFQVPLRCGTLLRSADKLVREGHYINQTAALLDLCEIPE